MRGGKTIDLLQRNRPDTIARGDSGKAMGRLDKGEDFVLVLVNLH